MLPMPLAGSYRRNCSALPEGGFHCAHGPKAGGSVQDVVRADPRKEHKEATGQSDMIGLKQQVRAGRLS